MADWAGQLIMAQRQVTEIEQKVARQQQAVEQLRLQGANTSQSARLLAVMQQSLARAKLHVAFIEHKVAAETGDADRRKARTVLVDSLIAKHQPAPDLDPRSNGVGTPAPSQRLPSSALNKLGSR
jgi:hypothetical protein